jgi:hypothetical protein
MDKIKLQYKQDDDWFDLGYALEYNDVYASAQIKKGLACIEGENDEKDWHWLVLLENGKVAYIRGGCDYTGWDCQSFVDVEGEYQSIDDALSTLGLPTTCVNSDTLIREEFRKILEK